MGRVPALLVRILAALERRNLGEAVLVGGDAAAFAYEAKAGVRLYELNRSAGAPLSLQLLVADSQARDAAFAALRAADKSFIARQIGNHGQIRLEVVNARGWTVDIHANAASAAMLAPEGPLAIRHFSIPVVSEAGRMARLTTVPPSLYSLWAFREVARADLDNTAKACREARARQVCRLIETHLRNWSEELGSRARDG